MGPPPLAVSEVQQANAAPLAELLGKDLVDARFARGCRCFVVWMGDDVGGYGWLSTSPEWVGEISLEVKPRAGEGYIWNCFTVPEHRRKGIFRSLMIGISNVARAEGLKRLWIGSVAIPAEKAVGPSGFRPATTFSSVTIAGYQLALVFARDLELARDALEVFAAPPGLRLGRLGISIHRSRHRRH